MESLLVTEVSQVQAKQRAGRAGRTQDGKCFRLYSEETYLRSLPKVTVPEILRSNLASVVLQMKAMGINDVVAFDFMEPPDRHRLVKSLRMLFLLTALDADGQLTDVGRRLAEFPLEPQFARSLVEAGNLGCANSIATLVAMLSAEGIWFRPSRKNSEQLQDAEEAQQRFMHPLGDHLTLLRVYRKWEDNGCSPEWCKENYVHHRALRQARDIRGQLCEQLDRAGISTQNHVRHKLGEAVLRALCAGFFVQSARMCSAGGGWLTVEENVLVRPEAGSAVEESSCEWLLYTELIGNTVANCLMRTVSAVQHEWLQPFLPRLAEVDMQRLVGEAPSTKKRRMTGEPDLDPAQMAEQKEAKVSNAKERYLLRKQAQGK